MLYLISFIFLDDTCVIQVGNVKKEVVARMEMSGTTTSNASGMRGVLSRMPDSHDTDISNQYIAKENDDFVSSDSDTQFLLMK